MLLISADTVAFRLRTRSRSASPRSAGTQPVWASPAATTERKFLMARSTPSMKGNRCPSSSLHESVTKRVVEGESKGRRVVFILYLGLEWYENWDKVGDS
jgi:hypothetical protein